MKGGGIYYCFREKSKYKPDVPNDEEAYAIERALNEVGIYLYTEKALKNGEVAEFTKNFWAYKAGKYYVVFDMHLHRQQALATGGTVWDPAKGAMIPEQVGLPKEEVENIDLSKWFTGFPGEIRISPDIQKALDYQK
ncbi:hypothetical protein [Methyloglobulus sp.]|uniref:hypothetical protein n=1 Tax=Methyloglobulus sp. TaxID=2518622 RepID=UPI0032B81D42